MPQVSAAPGAKAQSQKRRGRDLSYNCRLTALQKRSTGLRCMALARPPYTEARPLCSVTIPAVQDSKATPPKPDRCINSASSPGVGKRATDSGR
jgi:hypothetical protein